MPRFELTDRRHPVNRARLIHAAALLVDPPGTLIPTPRWRRYLVTGLAVTRQMGHDYTRLMEDLQMVRIHDREGVELLPAEGVILPLLS